MISSPQPLGIPAWQRSTTPSTTPLTGDKDDSKGVTDHSHINGESCWDSCHNIVPDVGALDSVIILIKYTINYNHNGHIIIIITYHAFVIISSNFLCTYLSLSFLHPFFYAPIPFIFPFIFSALIPFIFPSIHSTSDHPFICSLIFPVNHQVI